MMLCTCRAYAFLKAREVPLDAGPAMIVLISPTGLSLLFLVCSFWAGGFVGRVLVGRLTYFCSLPCRMSVSTCSFNAMQSFVRCLWSLWNLQYKFLGMLLGSERILPGHRSEGSSCICMRSLSISVFRGVKLPNFTEGVVVCLHSGVSLNFGTFCLASSYLRSSMSFRFFGGGSSIASRASSAFMCFVASYISSDMVSGGFLQRS